MDIIKLYGVYGTASRLIVHSNPPVPYVKGRAMLCYVPSLSKVGDVCVTQGENLPLPVGRPSLLWVDPGHQI